MAPSHYLIECGLIADGIFRDKLWRVCLIKTQNVSLRKRAWKHRLLKWRQFEINIHEWKFLNSNQIEMHCIWFNFEVITEPKLDKFYDATKGQRVEKHLPLATKFIVVEFPCEKLVAWNAGHISFVIVLQVRLITKHNYYVETFQLRYYVTIA